MKAAQFVITGELLIQCLHLPERTVVRGAEMTADGRDIVLIVEHPDLPETDEPTTAWPEFRRQDPVVFVDWGLRA